jgi:Ca2+/H+ antiporter
VLGINPIARDGKTTWYTGAQLLIAYAILGVGFYVHD